MVRTSKHACLSAFLGWGLAFVGMLTGLPVLAQSYQSSFSDVKFDRAKGPATFTAGVEVDAATGAASMNIPFGPGIGERGLKFRPMLSMRIAPQLRIMTEDIQFITGFWDADRSIPMLETIAEDTLFQSSFGSASFFPGTMDTAHMATPIGVPETTYSLPDGGGGRTKMLTDRITVGEAQALLGKFGFDADETVAYRPSLRMIGAELGLRQPYLELGSSGHLIVGLRKSGDPGQLTDELEVSAQSGAVGTPIVWNFPRRMVVIQGDAAYEFHYVSHSYLTQHIPYLANNEKTMLNSGHYVLVKIRNRFKEFIKFSYDADGIGYVATWSAQPAVQILVKVIGAFPAPAGQPSLLTYGANLSQVTRIQVSYEGMSRPVPSYLLDVSDPRSGGPLLSASLHGPTDPSAAQSREGQKVVRECDFFDTAAQSLQPVRVRQVESEEEIAFQYGPGPGNTGSNTGMTPTVLSRVIAPTRMVNLTWQAYRFRMNFRPDDPIPAGSARARRPSYTYGVTVIEESVAGGGGGTTIHRRVLPESNWLEGPASPPVGEDEWVKTDFYDAITHPDGTISVHRFVAPTSLMDTTIEDDKAFLKTVEREVRYYTNGPLEGLSQAELAISNPTNSSAYKWVVKDRFTNNAVGWTPVLYPTRIRTYDKESQVLTIEEMTDWDDTARGWKTTHTAISITASPDTTFEYSVPATVSSTYPSSQGVHRRVDRTFEPKASDWYLARVKTEKSTTLTDNTGALTSPRKFGETGASSLLTNTYHSEVNRVESVTLSGGDLAVTTAFRFKGTEGVDATELLDAYLTSPGLVLSGLMGVSAYGYDSLGHLSSITQKPNSTTALTVQQTSDELGRPVTQTDMNGTVKTFELDAGGRLSRISSSDGDVATEISYDSDHRGVTVTRGVQVAQYRYNGFGLILERRKGPDNQWSHRIHGYDTAGRKTGETVWLPRDGQDHEGEWSKPNLTRSLSGYSTVTTPERTVCKKWGQDPDGNAVCITWQTIPASTTTVPYDNPALFPGVAIGYDARNRVIFTQDGNGVQTTTEYLGVGAPLPPGSNGYAGPFRKVTVGTKNPQEKWFEHDATGRLIGVVTPVRDKNNNIQNLRSEYRYDNGGRIREVKQFDSLGQSQTRTWTYNGLGWLKAMVQPESGTTTYDLFTVAGKPTVTDYAGRVVTTTPDWMGRPIAVTGDNGLTQAFSYDTAIDGKGLLATSTDTSVLGRVTTTFGYGGRGKRLGNLKTKIETKGITQEFTQTFDYDTYGNRDSGHTSHAPWAQSYHFEAGLPKQLTVGTNVGTKVVADTPWGFYDPTSWALKNIAYGNGAKSTFNYDADQTRLTGMTHLDGAQTIQENWAYTYNDVGNLVRQYDKKLPDGNNSFVSDQYGYDELNRLISAVIQSPTHGEHLQQFDYDGFGNRIASSINRVTGWNVVNGKPVASLSNSTVSTTYNTVFSATEAALVSKNQLPARMANNGYTGAIYDAQGNLIQVFEKPGVAENVLTMAYDAFMRVTSVSNSGTGVREEYLYRPDGLRTVIHEYQHGIYQKSRIQVYNDARQLVAQYERSPGSSSAAWKRDIVYLGSREAAEIDSAGMHVTQVDHLGSPRVVTGPTGAVESRQKFLPFGEQLTDPTSMGKFAKGFTNHEQTDASGMIYMQARFYLPMYGRFGSPDPGRDQHFEDTQSWNIYSYVRNNPVMMVDPTGEAGFWAGVWQGIKSYPANVWQTVRHPIETGRRQEAQRQADVQKHGLLGAAVRNGLEQSVSAMPGMSPLVGEVKAVATAIKGDMNGAGQIFGNTLAATATEAGLMYAGAKVGALGKGTSAVSGGVDAGAKSALDGLNLGKSLASQAQMSEAGTSLAGFGSKSGRLIDDINRLVAEWGGSASDWAKKSSTKYTAADGATFETHWYENAAKGLKVEQKTKLLPSETPLPRQ